MPINKYISQTEYKLLLIFAFTAFIFVVLTITFQIVKSYNYSVAETQTELKNQANGESNLRFSGNYVTRTMPLLHFLTLFIFLSLLKTKRFLLPAFLTIFYAVFFIYGLVARYDGGRLGGEEFSPKIDFFEKLYRSAESFDYIAALFISILLFWQISILLRMLLKTVQRKNELL